LGSEGEHERVEPVVREVLGFVDENRVELQAEFVDGCDPQFG
jgi:hypothetical protein